MQITSIDFFDLMRLHNLFYSLGYHNFGKNSSVSFKKDCFEAPFPTHSLSGKTIFSTLKYNDNFYISIRNFYISLNDVQNKAAFFRLNVRILQRSGQSFFRLVEETFFRSE